MTWERMTEEFWHSEMDAQTAEARRAEAYSKHENNYWNARRVGDPTLGDISLDGMRMNGNYNDWLATYMEARRVGDTRASAAAASWMRDASHFGHPRGPAGGQV